MSKLIKEKTDRVMFRGSCPICRLGEIDSDEEPKCDYCKAEFCVHCGCVKVGTNLVSTSMQFCECQVKGFQKIKK